MKRIALAVAAVPLLAVIGCDWSDGPPVLYRAPDQAYVRRALALYSGNGRVPPEQVAREVTPVVVHLPTMICVGLNLRRGAVGGDTTVCYARESGKVVLTYVNGD